MHGGFTCCYSCQIIFMRWFHFLMKPPCNERSKTGNAFSRAKKVLFGSVIFSITDLETMKVLPKNGLTFVITLFARVLHQPPMSGPTSGRFHSSPISLPGRDRSPSGPAL